MIAFDREIDVAMDQVLGSLNYAQLRSLRTAGYFIFDIRNCVYEKINELVRIT